MKIRRKKLNKYTEWITAHSPVNRLDRYIIGKFLGTYFFSIALIISIAVVFDFNENIDRFLSNNAPVSAILFDYYLNFIPYYSNLFSQLFDCVIASVSNNRRVTDTIQFIKPLFLRFTYSSTTVFL